MTTLHVVFWLATAISLATAAVNSWQIYRRRQTDAAASAQLRSFADCVAMVAFLSRPESGSPEPLRTACAQLVPPGVTLRVEPGPVLSTRTH